MKLKILQAKLQQYMNQELPDVQVVFRKCRDTRDQVANICWIIRNSYCCFIDYAKAFNCVYLYKCGKFLKRRQCQTTLPICRENCMQVKKQQLEADMEQQTDSK